MSVLSLTQVKELRAMLGVAVRKQFLRVEIHAFNEDVLQKTKQNKT